MKYYREGICTGFVNKVHKSDFWLGGGSPSLALPNSYHENFGARKDTEEQGGSFYLGLLEERCAFPLFTPSACFKFYDVSSLSLSNFGATHVPLKTEAVLKLI